MIIILNSKNRDLKKTIFVALCCVPFISSGPQHITTNKPLKFQVYRMGYFKTKQALEIEYFAGPCNSVS